MKNTHNCFVRWSFLAALFLITMPAGLIMAQPFQMSADDSPFFKDIHENFKKQIEQAVPVQAIVQPVKKRKLLVVNINIRDKKMTSLHASVPYANYAIYRMGTQTGAFETYFTNDTLAFSSDILQQFDGLVLNNTVGVLFESTEKRQALLDYVYGGGGIMGIHGGAGATFVQYPVYDQFPEFGEMMGGYENGGHPWKTHEFINMVVDEPLHPINSGFEVRDFDISDEIYQYTDPYSREHVRVILSVNTEKSDMSPERRFLPERNIDNDFPVSWLRSFGRGRVFNTSLGHHPHINWDLRILNHNFRAIQYILGDLPAPSTPNNKLTASVLAQEKLGWRLGLTAWTFKDLTLLETIDKAAELGIWYMDGLNVQMVSPELDKNFDHNLSEEELRMIRRKLLSKGVAITNFYIHDIPADEKECERIFEFGRLMGIENFIAEPKPEALPLIDKYCQKYNVGLAIHNHGPDLSPVYWDPKLLLKAIEGRSNMIGVCGDMGYWQRNGIDPANAIKMIGKKLRTIQVHDLNVVSKEGHDVPWGTGKSNLAQIFRMFAELDIQPALIGLEYSYNWGKSMPEIQASKAFFDKTVISLAVQTKK